MYTLFFLFLLKNIDCGYPLKPQRRGGSSEYPQSISDFLSENCNVLVVTFSVYLNWHVFVMVE